jgi:hypothetical protein
MPKLTPDVLDVLTAPVRVHLDHLEAASGRLGNATTEEERRQILTEAKAFAGLLASAADDLAGYVRIATV